MLVSATEKNAEITSSTASAASCHCSDMSNSGGVGRGRRQYSPRSPKASSRQAAAEDDFDDEPAADIGEKQHHETGKRPAQRAAAAPAVAPASGEQQAEDQAREDCENGLVVEAHRPAEHLLRVDRTGDEREREQHEAERQDAEQQPLEREERWQAGERSGEEARAPTGRLTLAVAAPAEQAVAMEATLDQCHQKRVHRADREQAVSEHRERKMRAEREPRGIRRRGEAREEPGQEDAYRGRAEHDRLHAFQVHEQALEPVDEDREP